MYFQVLLITMHSRAAGVAAVLAFLSEWLYSRCSSESPGGAKVKGYKIQSNLHLWDAVKVVSTEKW